MLHAHVTPKSIKIICLIPKFLGYTYKKQTNCQKIIKHNLLKNKNSKDKSFNLIALFFKTRHVFKNKSIKFDKGSLNTGITKYFSIWQTSSPCLHRQSSDCTPSWCTSADDIGGIFKEDNKKHGKLSLLNKIWVQTNKTFYKQSKKKQKQKFVKAI